MNENVNWKKHVICSAHWSSGKRENKNHLPDIICTEKYLEDIEQEFARSPSKELKRKIECAKRVLRERNSDISATRKAPITRKRLPLSCPLKNQVSREKLKGKRRTESSSGKSEKENTK